MADLPDEILRLIMGRLCFEDLNRFRSVCRSWRSVRLGEVKPRFQLPWLLVFSDMTGGLFFPGKTYFLHNPSTGKSYRFDASFPDHPYDGPVMLATNSGWLLGAFVDSLAEPFFYNPFTRRTVQLPANTTMPIVGNRARVKYAFHYCPVERRFTVYAAWVVPGLVVVSSWRSGEQEWETHEIAGVHGDRDWAALEMACDGKGALYCCFVKNKFVVLFRRAGRGSRFDCVEVPHPEARCGWHEISLCASEEGDLYAVFVGFGSGSRAMRLDLAGRGGERWKGLFRT